MINLNYAFYGYNQPFINLVFNVSLTFTKKNLKKSHEHQQIFGFYALKSSIHVYSSFFLCFHPPSPSVHTDDIKVSAFVNKDFVIL